MFQIHFRVQNVIRCSKLYRIPTKSQNSTLQRKQNFKEVTRKQNGITVVKSRKDREGLRKKNLNFSQYAIRGVTSFSLLFDNVF